MPAAGAKSVRVAIASVGLGRIQRGYERYFNGIFTSLRDKVEIVLFKAGGPQSVGEKVPAWLGAATRVCRVLPLGAASGAGEYRTYKHDCLAFALTMLPHLLRNEFDVVHVIDYPLAIALLRFRRIFRFRARIIFSDGGLMPPQYYPRADYFHVTAQVHFLEAIEWGVPKSHATMIPCGFYACQFNGNADRRDLRKKHGVSQDTFVVLSVAALNRAHKRVDHIIDEVARLSGDILLWMDGREEDKTLIPMAREKLGRRCRISHVRSEEVTELYHLADVFVHASLCEAFGLAVCEAAASGLPVLVHDAPHFRWLVDDPECLVDMTQYGALAARIEQLMASRQELPKRGNRLSASMRARFDWEVLAPAYGEMYRSVADLKSRN